MRLRHARLTEFNGNHLRQRRKELRLTLEQVGDIVGVGKSTVRKWETGDIENMRRDKIALLAKALKTTPLFIMGIAETVDDSADEFQLSDEDVMMINKFRILDGRGKHTVRAILDVEYERCTKPYLEVVAAHNDDYSEEQQELIRRDLEKLEELHARRTKPR